MSIAPIETPPRGALFAALAKAQAKIKHASKDATNPHFGRKYADLASVAEACKSALTEQGICVIQDPYTDGAQVACVTVLGHSSGEVYESRPLVMTPADLKPQTVGSCVTYLRRYQLASVVGVAPDDDDGNAAQGGGPKGNGGASRATPPAKKETAADIPWREPALSPDKLKLIHVLRKKCGGRFLGDEEDAKTYWRLILQVYRHKDGKSRIESSKDLSDNQGDHLIDRMKAYIEKTNGRVERMEAETPIAAAAQTDWDKKIGDAIDGNAMVMELLCGYFGIDSYDQLKDEDKPDAFERLSRGEFTP